MIKPIDILVATALIGLRREDWTYASLAEQLAISSSAAHRSVDVLGQTALFDASRGRIRASALYEFLVHGLKYVCPPQLGPRTRGFPTGPFAEPLSAMLGVSLESGDAWVWPAPDGPVAGASFTPLHPNAPAVARRDDRMYQRLAVIDALRAGRARESRLASDWLRDELELGDQL